jgi:hypothetical protein
MIIDRSLFPGKRARKRQESESRSIFGKRLDGPNNLLYGITCNSLSNIRDN